jgi:hypothetical protein
METPGAVGEDRAIAWAPGDWKLRISSLADLRRTSVVIGSAIGTGRSGSASGWEIGFDSSHERHSL